VSGTSSAGSGWNRASTRSRASSTVSMRHDLLRLNDSATQEYSASHGAQAWSAQAAIPARQPDVAPPCQMPATE
ncbi:MAG TPA: hypothetical protein VF725_06995, partial [Ktedonobacterales bacterium]